MQLFMFASVILAAILQFNADVFIYFQPLMLEQPWRFLTAHWVHVGWIHYVMNMMALLCVPLIFPKLQVRWLIFSAICLPVLMSSVFYCYYPELQAYAGFSGVLHGIYVIAAFINLNYPSERKFALLILIGLIIKLFWEVYVGGAASATAQLIGYPVLIEAHQWGVLFALIFVGLGYLIRHKKMLN